MLDVSPVQEDGQLDISLLTWTPRDCAPFNLPRTLYLGFHRERNIIGACLERKTIAHEHPETLPLQLLVS